MVVRKFPAQVAATHIGALHLWRFVLAHWVQAEPARAFDSNAGSQWKNDELVPLVFSFDGAVAATKFTLTTSTLSSLQDPVRWQLHASEDKVRGFWRIKTVSTGWLLSFRVIVCWCKTFERWYVALSKFSNFQTYESDFKGNKVDLCMHVVFVLSCRILECFTRTGIAMSFGHNMTCGLMTSLPSKKHWKSWPRPPGLFSMSNLWILQFRKVAVRRVKPFHWISAVKVVESNSITSPVAFGGVWVLNVVLSLWKLVNNLSLSRWKVSRAFKKDES